VNIYLCKLLIFVCCNISGIESFLNQRFFKSIKLSSTQIKGLYEIKIRVKTGTEDTFQNHEPDKTVSNFKQKNPLPEFRTSHLDACTSMEHAHLSYAHIIFQMALTQ